MGCPAIQIANPKGASRAIPAPARRASARRFANPRGVREKRHRYDQPASSGSVVANDPVNKTDPTGKIAQDPLKDLIIGTIHGLGATVQVQATGNSALAEVGVGAYVGQGPEGDLRVGVNLTSGPQVGNDVSVNAGVTVYGGDTSNVRGFATEASAGTLVGGVTAGYTTSRFDQAGPDSSSVPFAGVAVGPSVAPVSGHVSKQVTVANDVRVPMSPGARVVSATVSAGRAVVNSWVRGWFGR